MREAGVFRDPRAFGSSEAEGAMQCTRSPRSRTLHSRVLPALFALLLFSVFIALGTWQVQRREWKHELIARVGQRVHAAPVAAPGPQGWSGITAQSDEYRHVAVTGTFLHEHTVLVQAVTDFGAGYWAVTPLRTTQGWLVLVNRGFVAARTAAPALAQPDAPPVTITGLLRMTEPGGAFLRKNAPGDNRWYSRDVAAISAARGLAPVAPYFIDAGAAPASPAVTPAETTANPPEAKVTGTREGTATGIEIAGQGQHAGAERSTAPIAGLTVIAFADNHLVYALTWYALASMVGAATVWLYRTAPRPERDGGEPDTAGSGRGGDEAGTHGLDGDDEKPVERDGAQRSGSTPKA